ncbi:hypothetical protein GW916_14465 [bacterium]|nr:hypothetical protein [bacterium]
MKTLAFLLLLAPFATTALAQSAGGGGGGDRPMNVKLELQSGSRAQSIVQVNADTSTCSEVRAAVKVFGKLRLNEAGLRKRTYSIVADEVHILGCTSGSVARRAFVETRDKNSCSVGYTCETRANGR